MSYGVCRVQRMPRQGKERWMDTGEIDRRWWWLQASQAGRSIKSTIKQLERQKTNTKWTPKREHTTGTEKEHRKELKSWKDSIAQEPEVAELTTKIYLRSIFLKSTDTCICHGQHVGKTFAVIDGFIKPCTFSHRNKATHKMLVCVLIALALSLSLSLFLFLARSFTRSDAHLLTVAWVSAISKHPQGCFLPCQRLVTRRHHT